MSLNVLWDFTKTRRKEALLHNLEMLSSDPLVDQVFVARELYDQIEELASHPRVSPYKDREVFTFLADHPDKPVARLRSFHFKAAPGWIAATYKKMQETKTLHAFSDASDLCVRSTVEILDPMVLESLRGEKPYLPDGNLDLFHRVPSVTYLMDYDLQAFYYVDCYDDYFKYPKGINLEPALVCNLTCDMCMYHSEKYSQEWMEKNKGLMPWETYQKIVDEISEYPQKPCIELCYRGEPLLNKDLPRWVQYARDKGIYITLVTNSTLMYPDVSDALIKAGLNGIYFSLEGGTPETYNKIRKGADYNKMLENVLYYIKKNDEEGHPTKTCVRSVKLDEVKHEQQQMLDYWLPKVDHIILQNQTYPGGWFEDFPIWANPNSIVSADYTRYPCHLLWNNLTITTQGNVANCIAMVAENDSDIIGNVNDTPLYTMWNSDEMQRRRLLSLKKQFEDIPLCNGCDGNACSGLTKSKEYNDGVFATHHVGVDLIRQEKPGEVIR